ncbi:MAG TPA: methylenetetrahydrofolate reductase [NAD(P)H] [Ruminococcaceae bacterium]|nr:methylenetetrahydrofolate reductase [NAD(P)H] [Oscillospiraceae bacterium]
MKINEIARNKKVTFSYEIFPPKPNSPVLSVYESLDKLSAQRPDFISVTYGAGGSLVSNKTLVLSSYIQDRYNIPSMAHLTCINSSKQYILAVLEQLKANGVYNVLALRGDKTPDITPAGDFNYASELIEFIKNNSPEICISAACYPEGHIDGGFEKDIQVMKDKYSCGAEHFISQLFFDNSHFYRLMDRAAQLNINANIEAGIMPVLNKNQIERMVSMCGCSFPEKFRKMVERYQDDKSALLQAGINFATEQITDLLSNDVKGIHLYTMNRPEVSEKINENVRYLVDYLNA